MPSKYCSLKPTVMRNKIRSIPVDFSKRCIDLLVGNPFCRPVFNLDPNAKNKEIIVPDVLRCRELFQGQFLVVSSFEVDCYVLHIVSIQQAALR